MEDKVEDILRNGDVPPKHQNYTERMEFVQEIRKCLFEMKDSDSWIVLHGLPGYGKGKVYYLVSDNFLIIIMAN